MLRHLRWFSFAAYDRSSSMITPSHFLPALLLMLFLGSDVLQAGESPSDTKGPVSESWSFVSIPDFLNLDIEYAQKGWEDALGFILESMKKEEPAFSLLFTDLLILIASKL